MKAESRQVFLFDHRIFVALPASSDGFFDYQMDIRVCSECQCCALAPVLASCQTLKGSLKEVVEGEPLRFSFTTADKSVFVFQVLLEDDRSCENLLLYYRLHQRVARGSGYQPSIQSWQHRAR